MKKCARFAEILTEKSNELCLQRKLTFRKHGNKNLWILFPSIIITSFWGLLIGSNLPAQYADSLLLFFVTLAPYFIIPPFSYFTGILRSIPCLHNDKAARHCLACSIVGLLFYLVSFPVMGWLGSRM